MPKRGLSRPWALGVAGVMLAALMAHGFAGPSALAAGEGTSVGAIWTDFGGVWNSATNPAIPDTDHNLLAFEAGGSVYSTGVNDAALTTAGVGFTPATFEALPVEGLPTTASSNYFVARGNNEPSKPGFTASPTAATLASFLTSGTNGLNLGSGITNIPANTLLTFNLVGGITSSASGDAVPDVLITQIANPSASRDWLEFRDSSNNVVGNRIEIDQNASPSVTRPGAAASFNAIYYDAVTAVSPGSPFSFPVASVVRMRSYELSEFGITGANASQVTKLVWNASGSSDPAFFAYNTSSLSVVGGSTTIGTSTTTLSPIADTPLAQSTVQASATNSAGLTLSYSSSTTGVCTVDSGTGLVTLVAEGTCTITAGHAQTQVGSTIYPATSDTVSFQVTGVGPPQPPAEPSAPVAPQGDPAIALDVRGAIGSPASEIRAQIAGTGLPLGSQYRLLLRSPEAKLASGVVGAAGSFQAAVPLPADLGPGDWMIELVATMPDGRSLSLLRTLVVGADGLVVDLGVNAPGGAAPIEPQRLAYTGLSSGYLPWWALTSLLLGFALVAYSLRARELYLREMAAVEAPRPRTPWEILQTPIRVPGIDYEPGSASPGAPAARLPEIILELDRSLSMLIGARVARMRGWSLPTGAPPRFPSLN